MNTNFLHNIINVLIAVIAAATAVDWNTFFDTNTSVTIIAVLAAAKTVINIIRDGVSGLTKQQPPVVK